MMILRIKCMDKKNWNLISNNEPYSNPDFNKGKGESNESHGAHEWKMAG